MPKHRVRHPKGHARLLRRSVEIEVSAGNVVTDVGSDDFTLQTGDDSTLRLHMAADALSNLNLQTCDLVDVTYHQNAGLLVADSVTVTGTSTAGDCAPTMDTTGVITQVSADVLTLKTDSGPLSFSVDRGRECLVEDREPVRGLDAVDDPGQIWHARDVGSVSRAAVAVEPRGEPVLERQASDLPVSRGRRQRSRARTPAPMTRSSVVSGIACRARD
jgi:hypothetical protein